MRKNQLLKEFQSSDKSIKSIANISTNFLINNQIKNGRNETEWYLQKLYQCDSIGLYNLKNQSINHDILNQMVDFLVKRCNKIPFQHLIGYAPFYGRDYIVNRNTLIPRQESEILIDLIKDQRKCRVLDLGTGSGCLAITTSLEGIADKVDAIDINNRALMVAKKNSIRLNAQNINYIKMDILKNIPDQQYDIVISNPPYISKLEYQKLNEEIKQNEPVSALTDMNDGCTFYKRYAGILKKILKQSGIAIFELSHFFNKETLVSIFQEFPKLEFHKDLNNDMRAIKIIND